MTRNTELRLFTALVYALAIIFVTSYILLSKQTPEEHVTPHEKKEALVSEENKTEGSPP